MNVTTMQDESTAARCLGLIERHAARYMKIGGGSLMGGLNRDITKKCMDGVPDVTPSDIEKVCAAARKAFSMEEIVKQFPWSDMTIYRILRNAGEPTPFQRLTGKRRGPPKKGVKHGRRQSSE